MNQDSDQPFDSGDPEAGKSDASPEDVVHEGDSHARGIDPAESSSSDPPPDILGLFGGSAELTALADEDANELLRFVESSMTESESAQFLAQLESRDPLAAMRLLRMQEDHRLLRTTGEVPVGRDLLGPVRARVARGEIVADSNFAAGAAEPTQFMERSLESLVRRRRWNAKRRPVQILLAVLMVAMLFVVVFWGRGRFVGTVQPTEPGVVASEDQGVWILASFGLVVPVTDPARIETEIALIAIERGVVLVRNLQTSKLGDAVSQPVPIVGRSEDGPPDELRQALADRGFGYALVMTRGEASAVLAEIGQVAAERDGRFSARLVSTKSTIQTDLSQDAWTSWSRQAEAVPARVDTDELVVVPLAMMPFTED